MIQSSKKAVLMTGAVASTVTLEPEGSVQGSLRTVPFVWVTIGCLETLYCECGSQNVCSRMDWGLVPHGLLPLTCWEGLQRTSMGLCHLYRQP